MRSRVPLLLSSMALLACGADWPGFRGPDGAGFARDAKNLPTSWGPDQNIAWKVGLPGAGLSAPIIVGDRVIVTSSGGPLQDQLFVTCFDASTGNVRWQRQCWATGRTMKHPVTSIAACTPVSDGKQIYALYSTNDVVCLDLEGNLQWLRGLTHDYPNVSNSLGMASSPTVVGDTLVVQVENDSLESYALGINVATGENRWKLNRPSRANWASPVVVRGKSRADDIVLLQSSPMLTAHEPRTGEVLWTYAKNCSTVPSSAVVGRIVYVPSQGLTALEIPMDGSPPRELWSSNLLAPSTPSPIVFDGRVYSLAKNGVLRCGDAQSGERLWQLRMKGPFSATPVAADGHIFAINEEGLGQVVKPGDTGAEIVGKGQLDGKFLGTPAIGDDGLYVRNDARLWKIALQ